MNNRQRRVVEFGIERVLFLCAAASVLVTAGIIACSPVRDARVPARGVDRRVPDRHRVDAALLGKAFRRPAAGGRHAARLGHRDGRGAADRSPGGNLPQRVCATRLRRVVKPLLEVLAGVPTVVYGYFALLLVTPLLQRFIPSLAGFNALGPGIVMGIMILPLVSSLSEDALHAVPNGLREGAFALGSTRMQATLRVVVPAAFSGISASFILAVSRAIGETMIVAVAAGQQPRLTANPLVPIETMTAYIVQVSLGDTPAGTLEYRTIFAVGMLLFVMTFVLNLVSNRLRRRFREEYA